MKRQLITLILTLGLVVPMLAFAGSGSPWLHIEVDEDNGRGAQVKVNLPLSLAKMALEIAGDMDNEYISNGNLTIDNADISVRDLRKLWQELRNAGDATFVTVEEENETVEISRKGDFVYVNVDSYDGDEMVRMEIPVSLVDALLSGSGNELDLAAAVAELQESNAGEIITIQDGRDRVRVWID